MTHIVKTKDGIEIDLAEVQRLWDNPEMSATQIGAIFGVSKGVILGHTNRNKDMFPPRKTGQKPGYKFPSSAKLKKAGPKVSAEAKAAGRRVNVQNIHKARQDASRREVDAFKDGTSKWLQIPLSDEERLATAKELMDLEPNDCRWPLGNGPFLFCASHTDGEVYCTHHRLRAYRPRERVA